MTFYTPKGNTGIEIEGAALAATAASFGVIPTPAVKCALILLIAAFESQHDLDVLKKGGKAPLVKINEEQWECTMSQAGNWAEVGTREDAVTSGLMLSYRDYMYIFLFLKCDDLNGYPTVLKRIGDLIAANIRMQDGHDSFDLSNSYCYYELSCTVKVKPLMLDLDLVKRQSGVSDFTASTGWCTYNLDVIRGYS